MNINNPTTFSAPNLTLTTANSAGTAGALRADDSILIYDVTAVDAITFGQSGSVGSAATASRRDHAHAMAADPSPSAASQAEMEAASSNTVYATPGRTKYSPGVAKVWADITVSTGTLTLRASFNVASITDLAVGRVQIDYTVAFSTDYYSSQAFSDYDAVDNDATDVDKSDRIKIATRDSNGNNIDGAIICFGAWGDQ